MCAHVANRGLRDCQVSSSDAIEGARSNARSVRTALTREVWEAINETWMRLSDALGELPDQTARQDDQARLQEEVDRKL